MIYRTNIDGEYVLHEGEVDEVTIPVTGWYYPGLPGTMINPPEPESVEVIRIPTWVTLKDEEALEDLIISLQH